MVCGLCGNKIKKKASHHRIYFLQAKKENEVCDKCWKLYIKQNRQMDIETAVYQDINGKQEA